MLTRLENRLAAFGRNQGGNTAMIFGLGVVPILLLVASGIDYSRAIDQKSKLQQATDASTLAVTRLLSQNLASATLKTQAQNFLSAAVNDSNAVIVTGPTVSANNTAVCMTTQTTLNTTMMRVAVGMGFAPPSSMTVSGASCTKINDVTYEVALVLDNSGSMAAATNGTSKISSLITAAQQMVSTMNPVASTPRTTFSIVPFSSAVKVGTQYQTASFMDTAGQSSIHWQNFQLPTKATWLPSSKFELLSRMGASWGGCVEERPDPYMTTDTAASSSNPDTLFVPYFYPDEHTVSTSSNGKKTYGSSTNTYITLDTNGNAGSCQTSDYYDQADQGANVTPVKNTVANTVWNTTQTQVCKYKSPSSVLTGNSAFGSGFNVGPNLLCDSRPLTTLTNDNTILNAQIQALYAKGDTNLIGGVMWGWRTLSPNGPFNTQTTSTGVIGSQNAKPYVMPSGSTTSNVKVMIVMTDGMNHWADISSDPNGSAYSNLGFYANGRLGSTSSNNYRSLMDAQTLEACTNAKQAGVQIYTVGFSTTADPIDSAGLALLQSCATKAGMAYVAKDGAQLIANFQDIANNMSGLRLTN